jgi:hypothetical protein
MRRLLLVLSLAVALQAGADWERIADGVHYQHIQRGSLDAYVTRIDVRKTRTRVIASNESDRGLTISEFAKKNNALIAINADYFTEQIQPIGTSVGSCGTWWKGVTIGRKQGLVAFGRKRAEIQGFVSNRLLKE